MENVTTFLFKLDVKDRELLDASAEAVRQTRSAYLRSLIRHAALQLPIVVQLNEEAENEQDSK